MDIEAMKQRALEAKERANKATPGPWVERDNRDEGRGVSTVEPEGRGDDILCLGTDGLFADLAFVASARADVPSLADDMLALAALVEELEAKLSPTIAPEQERLYKIRRAVDDAVRLAGPNIDGIRREARARIDGRIDGVTDKDIDAALEQLVESREIFAQEYTDETLYWTEDPKQ